MLCTQPKHLFKSKLSKSFDSSSMAVNPQAFPPRKRRLSGDDILDSLLALTREIGNTSPLRFPLRRNSISMIRKAKLLSILFDELLQGPSMAFSTSAILCFEEILIALQRVKALIEDCSKGSKVWALMQSQTKANAFHELTAELSTLLDIFPAREIDLSDDVEELVWLVRKQCSETKPEVDSDDDALRHRVLDLLDRIKMEIVPDKSELADIFTGIGIADSSSCRGELEFLQDELQLQSAEETAKSELLVSLVGLVRYAKCVLFGPSTPKSGEILRRRSSLSCSSSSSEVNIPTDFRCPISLDLMRDPVVAATGQTYDRDSITLWIESGHNTCPKTGQTLANTKLIPNCALRNFIAAWCREQKIPFETVSDYCRDGGENGKPRPKFGSNKTAMEATRMAAAFLVNRLKLSEPDLNAVIYELRVLAKTDSESRACVAEAGALPYLAHHIGSENPSLQVNAVTAILNLSILEANKDLIMETDGAVNGLTEVLKTGATWEAKGNAAAAIFSLSAVPAHRKRLGKKPRVVKGLLELVRAGPAPAKRDALAAVLNLASDREGCYRLVEAGVVDVAAAVIDDGLAEEAVTIIEVVVRRGGLLAVAGAHGAVKKLGSVLRNGSERARECAAATLVTICRKGGAEMVGELAEVAGIERVVWEVMGSGTSRGRRKAATLLRIMRRWAAGLDSADHADATLQST